MLRCSSFLMVLKEIWMFYRFGNVLKGEVEVCQQIARQTGILVDPVYTLAAWEHATFLCQREAKAGSDAKVVMLHTGGTLGMFGLAQRYKSYFHTQRWGYISISRIFKYHVVIIWFCPIKLFIGFTVKYLNDIFDENSCIMWLITSWCNHSVYWGQMSPHLGWWMP